MSDENVGGLVAKWRGMVDENRRKPFRTAAEGVMCDTLNDCADELEAALSAHGQPVVDGERIKAALDIASRYASVDGAHHKDWVIDQMVRALTGDDYNRFVTNAKHGDDGPDIYEWNEGIAP